MKGLLMLDGNVLNDTIYLNLSKIRDRKDITVGEKEFIDSISPTFEEGGYKRPSFESIKVKVKDIIAVLNLFEKYLGVPQTREAR